MANTYSVHLGGTADGFSAVDHADFRPAGSFTIGVWVKSSSTTAEREIFCSYNHTTADYGIVFGIQSTHKLFIYSVDGTNACYKEGGTTIDDGNWYWTVTVYDGAHVFLYVNGASDVTPPVYTHPATFAVTNYVTIGCSRTPASWFPGNLDEVFIINGTGWSSTDVTNYYKKYITGATNLKAYYQFENNANDSSGNSHTLTAIGSPSYQTNVPFGALSTSSITKSLVYMVKSSPSAKTKALVYKVKPSIGKTKSLKYTIKITPAAKTKTNKYTVQHTPSAKTKSIKYTVIKTPTAKTKSILYEIKTVPSAKTKSIVYKVHSIHSAITKDLIYDILGISIIKITKSLTYKVIPHLSKTKSLKYTVIKTPTAKIKSLLYKVVVPRSKTSALKYVVISTSTAKTKSVNYKIKTIPSAKTKNILYKVIPSLSKTKSLKYTVKSTKTAITKSLQYVINTFYLLQENGDFLLQENGDKIIIENLTFERHLTKSLRYFIYGHSKTTKSIQYRVKAPIKAKKTKNLKYTVITVAHKKTKSLAYSLLMNRFKLDKILKYTVQSSPVITKGLRYFIRNWTKEEKLVTLWSQESKPDTLWIKVEKPDST